MMKRITIFVMLISTLSCAQVEEQQETTQQQAAAEKKPHQYGGWYCPDNLNGFPPVNISQWDKVPVISGRLPTNEETKTEASLMYIDTAQYPNARVMDIKLPQLATYYNQNINKKDHVIIIQAVEVGGDSVVGFRYLNGGNGSARYNEVNFLTDKEIKNIPVTQFVTYNLTIHATQEKIWKVITDTSYLSSLLPTFSNNLRVNRLSKPIADYHNPTNNNWRAKTTANYYYTDSESLTNSYANMLFGCYYVQNDYVINATTNYVEKFLLLEDKEKKTTELKIVAGPYQADDYSVQQSILQNWAKKVKELSEQ